MMQPTPPCSSEIANNLLLGLFCVCCPEYRTVVIKSVNDCLEAVVLHHHVQNAVVSADDVFPSLNHFDSDGFSGFCVL